VITCDAAEQAVTGYERPPTSMAMLPQCDTSNSRLIVLNLANGLLFMQCTVAGEYAYGDTSCGVAHEKTTHEEMGQCYQCYECVLGMGSGVHL